MTNRPVWPHLSFLHDELPDCASPIVSVSAVVPDLQGIHGTGFLARRKRNFMFITARHCLGNTLGEVESCVGQLRIPFVKDGAKTGEEDFLPFDGVFHLPNNNKDVPGEFVDISILPIDVDPDSDEAKVLEQRSVVLPPSGNWLTVFQHAMLELDYLTHGIRVVACGYPLDGTQTEIDLAGTVVNQLVTVVGHLQPGIFPDTMTMAQITWDHDMNGFSGSPVFLMLSDELGTHYALAGVLCRGGNQQGQFIRVGEFVPPYFACMAREGLIR